MHMVRTELKAHRFKVMARKRKSETSSLGMVGLYLPTDSLQGSFDADLRHEMYESLRGRTIPEALIEAVSGCAYHPEVVWRVPPELGSIIRDDHYDIVYYSDDSDAENGERLAQTWAEPKTAGEALAFCLSAELQALKVAGNSPVRSGGHLPHSTIAYIAFDLLQSYTVAPPGPHLQELIRALLKLSTAQQDQVGSYIAKEKAAYILAQSPELSLSTIADVVDVDRTTVSRWTKEEKFMARVSQLCEFMKTPEWTQMRQKEHSFQYIEVAKQVGK